MKKKYGMSPAEVEYKSGKDKKNKKGYYFERLRESFGKEQAEKSTKKPRK